MPKISKNTIKISNGKVDKNFDVEVYYNQKEAFYIQIPEIFNASFDHLTDGDKKELHASKLFSSQRARSADSGFKRIVSATTENEALSRMRKVIEKLFESQIKLREVIVLFYHNRVTNFNSHHYSKGFEALAFQMGITYCTEATVTGGKPKYYIYSFYKGIRGEERPTRSEVHIWNDACTIIDNTPANKEFVEGIYNAMKILDQKLTKFTATPEALLGLIASNQKLLN